MAIDATGFKASYVKWKGLPALCLSYKSHVSKDPKNIYITEINRQTGFTGTPYSFSFSINSQDIRKPYPVISIIAGPGVNITLEGYPVSYFPSWEEIPAVQIIRVQDCHVIPPMGSSFSSSRYLNMFEVNRPREIRFQTADNYLGYPDNYFVVKRVEDGVQFYHYFNNQCLELIVPEFSKEQTDTKARFAYEIDENGIYGRPGKPLIRIVKTKDVTAKMVFDFYKDELANRIYRRLDEDPRANLRPFWEIWEVDDINLIPQQGDAIVPQPGWRVGTVLTSESLRFTLLTTAMDLNIGMIPVLGDLVDIGEFLYALFTDKDKWGRKVTTEEKVMMGIGALLPFVSSAVLKGSQKLVGKFGNRAVIAEEVIEALKRSRLTAEDADFIRNVTKAADLPIKHGFENSSVAIETGIRLSSMETKRTRGIINKFESGYWQVEQFLGPKAKGFTHTELQELYVKYKQINKKELSPIQWMIEATSKKTVKMLETMFGKDFRKALSTAWAGKIKRLINIVDIPLPPGLNQKRVEEIIKLLDKDREKVFERLLHVAKDRKTADGVVSFLNGQINAGHFRILKGNIAESLSRAIQHEVLFKTLKNHPNAKIYTGIRMKKVSGKRAVLFTDNIIATEKDGKLLIHATFEVKSGYRGRAAGVEQVFSWLEDKIEDGAELIIPAGSKVIGKDGKETIIRLRRSFVYSPDGTGIPNKVVDLLRAKPHLITAKGISLIDIGDEFGVYLNKIKPHFLDFTSAELDYIAGQMALRL
ncbi:MAG TPA: hypothetical protein VF487_06080 [Chitinophagaceae bacterium]